MTDREIFEKVRAHLLNQGVQALDPDVFDCQYRTPDGLMCAVGCLIPAEFYDPAIEGGALGTCKDGLWSNCYSVDHNDMMLVSVLNRCGIPANPSVQRLLNDLRKVHDGNDPSEWPTLLATMAAHFVGDVYVYVGGEAP